MSGTSLDGVDAVLADFAPAPAACRVLAAAHRAVSRRRCAPSCSRCRRRAPTSSRARRGPRTRWPTCMPTRSPRCSAPAASRAADVVAAGVHGQTVRHRPDEGWTLQLNNAGARRRARRHDGRRRFPQPRRRRRRAGRAAGARRSTPRCSRGRTRAPRRRQHRRHRQPHRPAARDGDGARLRHRPRQRAARPVVRAPSRRTLRSRRRVGAHRAASTRRCSTALLAEPYFARAAAEEHGPRPASMPAGSTRSSRGATAPAPRGRRAGDAASR